MKVGIIVPYRDRFEQLQSFKKSIINYLESKDMDYELIIIEQDDAKVFNRGKLLNIGFKYAKRLKCDYVVFHDVDMLPVDADYSYSNIPIHLASKFVVTPEFKRIVFDEYFGGVTIFPMDVFEKINGYSNEYWGWGYEDNDLLYRCKFHKVDLDKKEIPMMSGNTAALKFNGVDSYVEAKNTINTSGQLTFFTSFYPEDLNCNPEKYDDTFVVFGIPGLDLCINFNSYSRYNFEAYDSDENILYINSNIKTNYKTNICVTIEPKTKTITMYQDGILVGSTIYENRLYNYKQSDNFYLGVGNPNRDENKKHYRGLINSFAAYSKVLEKEEIEEISKNIFFGLTDDFGNYKSSKFLKIYYDAKCIKGYKLMDLTGNGNDAKIVNCDIVGYSFDDVKIIEIPFRRNCTFKLLPHEENGFKNGAWKNITTRYNQIRYHNEVERGYKLSDWDGLTNCEFKEHTYAKSGNQTHVLVGI